MGACYLFQLHKKFFAQEPTPPRVLWPPTMRHVSFDSSKQDLLRNGNDIIEEEEVAGEKDSKKKLHRKARGRKVSSSASEDEGSLIRRRLWRKLVEDDCKSSGTDVTYTSTTFSNQSNISVVELPPDFRAVIFIWSFSLVYALFDDQLMSKEPLDRCSLASSISSQLHMSSVLMALVIPFVLGPLLSTVFSQVDSLEI